MFISRSIDYAMRSLIYLGQDPDKKAGVREIAENMDVPTQYLSKLLRLLVAAELLESEKGPKGGYSLRKNPKSVTVSDVYKAVEGRFEVIACSDQEFDCDQLDTCAQVTIWQGLEAQIDALMSRITLQEFIDRETELQRNGSTHFVAIEQIGRQEVQ